MRTLMILVLLAFAGPAAAEPMAPWVTEWLVGRPLTGPAPDAYVVWPNAVGHIVGGPDFEGGWQVVVADEGGATVTQWRSVGDAIAFRHVDEDH